jgi:membrane associated rhomboid family serine protease
MKPLTVLYWGRVGLGVVAGLLCALLRLDSLLSAISFGILFYILTYYIIKSQLAAKVEKKSELFKMGIFVYFMAWIVGWILFNTLLTPS